MTVNLHASLPIAVAVIAVYLGSNYEPTLKEM